MEASVILLYSKIIIIILLGFYTVIVFYYILNWIFFLWAWRRTRLIQENNWTEDETFQKVSDQNQIIEND